MLPIDAPWSPGTTVSAEAAPSGTHTTAAAANRICPRTLIPICMMVSHGSRPKLSGRTPHEELSQVCATDVPQVCPRLVRPHDGRAPNNDDVAPNTVKPSPSPLPHVSAFTSVESVHRRRDAPAGP